MKKFAMFVCLTALGCTHLFSQQVVNNKGTKINLYFPSVSEVFPMNNMTIDAFSSHTSNVFVSLTLDGKDFDPISTDYTLVPEGIQVLKKGLYSITGTVTTEKNATNTAEDITLGGTTQLTKKTGSTTVGISRTNTFTYMTHNQVNKQTATTWVIVELDANDIVGIQVRAYLATNTPASMNVVAQGTRLIVERLSTH